MQMNEQLARDWLRDMPQQFQGKPKIEILVRALANQLEEVEAVFREINELTDIDTAHGKSLDYVGDIVCMSRKEAGELVNQQYGEPVISDERYREYLRYKVLRNTSDCTYWDIMQALDILWDVTRATYYERADRPATIFIGFPTVNIEDPDPAEGKPQILKPGGVGFIYTVKYGTIVDHRGLESVVFSSLDIHSYFQFFELRTLNGEWLLDGSVLLNQRVICNIGMGMAIGNIDVPVEEHFLLEAPSVSLRMDTDTDRVCVLSTDVHSYFRYFMYRVLNGEWPLDGAVGLNQKVICMLDIGMQVSSVEVKSGEQISECFSIMEKDLWYLNDTERLDGSRLLDAERREERL